MNYPSMDPYDQQPPERSPWSSPVVMVAIAAGALVVLAGVLAAFLLLPTSEPSDSVSATSAAAQTTTVTSTVSSTQTTPSTQTTLAPGQTTTVTAPTAAPDRPTPTIAGTDWQGFLTGPRCNAADDSAVAIGRTERSQIVVCQVGSQTGRLYYKGVAPEGTIEIGYPQQSGNTFRASNGPYEYLISPVDLTIFNNGDLVTAEPMLEFWQP